MARKGGSREAAKTALAPFPGVSNPGPERIPIGTAPVPGGPVHAPSGQDRSGEKTLGWLRARQGAGVTRMPEVRDKAMAPNPLLAVA